MNAIDVTSAILWLIAGVGVFLIACTMMSSNLESLGSRRLKGLFARTSKSKLIGVGVGTVTTAAIQSSSATTVMVIGFVNAGVMSLSQAATVIFGANIGTTITGQIVALGLFGGNTISTSVIFASLAGVGAFILAFAKKDGVQKTGGILAGFGMIFVGLSLMSGSMESIAGLEEVRNFLALFRNPFLLVLIGAILTAVIQSSSVMTSMSITMVVTGLITLNQGIYITMGSNIGTCATALIAGMTGSRNARRTALIHLIFNVSGVVIFLIVGLLLQWGNLDYGLLFGKMFPGAPQVQLAMFHTVFNVVTVILILPATDRLVGLVKKLVPERNQNRGAEGPRLHFIDGNLLKTPPIAVQQTKNEILDMADIAMKNFRISCDVVCTLNFEKIALFKANERQLDFLNREIFAFIVDLLKEELSEKDRIYLSTAFRTVSDLERVGDYAENIVEYAEKLRGIGQSFSSEAVKEIRDLKNLIQNLFDQVKLAYRDHNRAALKEVYAIEELVDRVTDRMAQSHIRRLSEEVCTPEVGAQYLSLSSDAERVADHFVNVANAIREYA